MDKNQQLQALVNAINGLNSLQIVGAQSDLVSNIKNLISQVGQALQKEVEVNAPLTSTGNTGGAEETEKTCEDGACDAGKCEDGSCDDK